MLNIMPSVVIAITQSFVQQDYDYWLDISMYILLTHNDSNKNIARHTAHAIVS